MNPAFVQDFYWRISIIVCNCIRKWTRAVSSDDFTLTRKPLSHMRPTSPQLFVYPRLTRISVYLETRLTRISAYLETRFRESRSQSRIFETMIERSFHRRNILRKLIE